MKVDTAHCLVQYWQIFSSLLTFCYYFIGIKTREISFEIRETWEIYPSFTLGTVR